MKTSLRKLRGFALHKHDAKERRDLRPLPQLDELAQAAQVRLLLFYFVAHRLHPPKTEASSFTTLIVQRAQFDLI